MRPFFTILALIMTLTLSCPATDLPYWEKLNTPDGAPISHVAEGKSGVIFALGSADSVYKSTNDGKSWAVVPNLLPHSVYSRELYSLDNGNLFQVQISPRIIHKSTDNGSSWSIFDTTKVKDMNSIFTDNKNNIYLYENSGAIDIYSDETGTWSKTDVIKTGYSLRKLTFDETGSIYALMYDSLYYSRDRKTWIKCLLPDRNVLSITLNSNGSLLASTDKGRIYLSTDNGASWSRKFEDTTIRIFDIDYLRNKVLLARSLYKGTLRSSDDGQSWQIMEDQPELPHSGKFLLSKSGKIFLAAPTGVLLCSDDGLNWKRSAEGMRNCQLTALFVSRENTIFAGTYSGVFKTTDQGKNWTYASFPAFSVGTVLETSKGTLFAVDTWNSAFRSTDKGQSWHPIVTLEKTDYYSNLCIAMDSSGVVYLYSYRASHIYKSSDEGSTWTFNDFKDLSRIWSMAFGKNKMLVSSNDSVLLSTDNGTSWSIINKGYPAPRPTEVYVSPNEDVYCLSNQNIYKSSDNGKTWTDIMTGLGIIGGSPSGADFTDDSKIFCPVTTNPPNNSDIYRNGEDGAWNRVGLGIEGTGTKKLDIRNGYLYVLSESKRGLFRLPIPTDNKHLSMNVNPRDTIELNWKDSLKYTVNVTDDKGAPIDSATVGMYNCPLITRVIRTTQNGVAELVLKIPVGTVDSTYSITIGAMAVGFINNPSETRYIRVKHSPSWKLKLRVEPEADTIRLDLNDSANVNFKATVWNSENSLVSSSVVDVVDSLSHYPFICRTNDKGYCLYASLVEYGKPLGIYPVKFIATYQGWTPSDTVTRYINVVNSTGIDEKTEPSTDLRISPDADNGTTTLFFFNSTAGEARFEIFNILGEKVVSEARQLHSGYCQEILNTVSLAPGAYYVKIYAAGRLINGKFITE